MRALSSTESSHKDPSIQRQHATVPSYNVYRDTRLTKGPKLVFALFRVSFICAPAHAEILRAYRRMPSHDTTRAPVRRESFSFTWDSEHAYRSARSYPPPCVGVYKRRFPRFHRPCWSICVKKEVETYTRKHASASNSHSNSLSNRRVLTESSRGAIAASYVYIYTTLFAYSQEFRRA